MSKLSKTQHDALVFMAHRAPAWCIGVGRISTLEALERPGFCEIRLGHYGWEGRITQKGLDLIGKA